VKYISTKRQIIFSVVQINLFLLYFVLSSFTALSQNIKYDVIINDFKLEQIKITENNYFKTFNFDNSTSNPEHNNLPYYINKNKIPSNVFNIEVKIVNENYSIFNLEQNDKTLLENIKEEIEVNFGVANSRGEKSAVVEILPLKKKNGNLYVLNSFTVEIYYDYSNNNQKSIK